MVRYGGQAFIKVKVVHLDHFAVCSLHTHMPSECDKMMAHATSIGESLLLLGSNNLIDRVQCNHAWLPICGASMREGKGLREREKKKIN
jgi:hypothetical protein